MQRSQKARLWKERGEATGRVKRRNLRNPDGPWRVCLRLRVLPVGTLVHVDSQAPLFRGQRCLMCKVETVTKGPCGLDIDDASRHRHCPCGTTLLEHVLAEWPLYGNVSECPHGTTPLLLGLNVFLLISETARERGREKH